VNWKKYVSAYACTFALTALQRWYGLCEQAISSLPQTIVVMAGEPTILRPITSRRGTILVDANDLTIAKKLVLQLQVCSALAYDSNVFWFFCFRLALLLVIMQQCRSGCLW